MLKHFLFFDKYFLCRHNITAFLSYLHVWIISHWHSFINTVEWACIASHDMIWVWTSSRLALKDESIKSKTIYTSTSNTIFIYSSLNKELFLTGWQIFFFPLEIRSSNIVFNTEGAVWNSNMSNKAKSKEIFFANAHL